MIAVYLACPYSKGDVAENVSKSIYVSDMLMRQGYLVYNPLLSHFHQLVQPHDYEWWMEVDLRWVEKCDCVYRLNGESAGADREVNFAKSIGRPVFTALAEMGFWREENK